MLLTFALLEYKNIDYKWILTSTKIHQLANLIALIKIGIKLIMPGVLTKFS